MIDVSAGSMVFASQMEHSLGVLRCPLHVHCSDEEREAPGRYPLDRREAIRLGNCQAIRFEQDALVIFE